MPTRSGALRVDGLRADHLKIARKYPAFLLFTTIVTSGAIFVALQGVLYATLEKEITSRGEATATFLAQANGPLLLEKNYSQLQYGLGALSHDNFIVNAIVANHEGSVVASLDPALLGRSLRETSLRFLLDPNRERWVDPATNVYHFRAPIRYSEVDLGTFVVTLSREPMQAAVARVNRWALLLVAGIAGVIAIFSLLLVQRELRPLRVMGLALRTIAKGDFSQRVPIQRNDEIGELAEAFNLMVVRSELFFHYVDKTIIERLAADDSLARPGGRLRDLAVLFGDMRGYTSMSNRRSADEVVRIVNTYFHLYIECIAHFRGHVDKTMGDAIMGVFEQVSDTDKHKHRELGVLALAYMKASSRVLNAFLQNQPEVAQRLGLEPREWGFAMATGPAIVGNIGSRRRMDYTVCGRVVNLASRLEGLTKSGEVIVDNFTRLEAQHLIEMESLPPVQPKGFSESEKVVPHRIISLNEDATKRMRVFMKSLFSYAFVQDKLMPADLPEREQHNWCATQHRLLEKIISDTPVEYFFARAEVHTSGLKLPQPTSLKVAGT